jgi:hypothetical protein
MAGAPALLELERAADAHAAAGGVHGEATRVQAPVLAREIRERMGDADDAGAVERDERQPATLVGDPHQPGRDRVRRREPERPGEQRGSLAQLVPARRPDRDRPHAAQDRPPPVAPRSSDRP